MQTKLGARKARDTLLAKDPEYFANIGRIGGLKSRGGGFAYDDRSLIEKLLRVPKRARLAGRIGGSISKRKPRDTKI